MKVAQILPLKRASVLFLVLTGLLLTGLSGRAQGVQHLSIIQPGGMPGLPVLTGIQQTTNGFKLTWDGPSGDYQIWHKIHLTDSKWLAVGGNTNLNRTATVTTLNSNDFFRISGPSPVYGSAMDCAFCHGNTYTTQTNTPHAQAFAGLQRIGQDSNPTCLPCHTVGYGLPSGFTSAAQTPQLEGVQCENCHGPAAVHAATPPLLLVVPRVELAAQVCGGCHSARLAPATVIAHHPMGFSFEDWSASPHGTVVPDALQSMARSANNITSCGRCHSGSAREALLEGENPSVTVANDYDVAITCAVCHDPHQTYAWTNNLNGVITFTNKLYPAYVAYITNNELGMIYTNQLRSPLASLQDYHASGDFATNYNAGINLCAQCHNDRGAAWTDTSRAPHHSPQYNMLLGTVGVLADGTSPNYPSAHSRLEMQCAECHMQAGGDNASGHTFEVATYTVCYNCHSQPAGLVQFTANIISNQIQQTKALLDLWATNAAPAQLQTNYGTFAWEYTTPGDLSPGGSGPDAAGQALIPDDIKKARFDLYLVLYDGSYGVHNIQYDIELLGSAQNFVNNQLPTNSLTLSTAASLQSAREFLDSQLLRQ